MTTVVLALSALGAAPAQAAGATRAAGGVQVGGLTVEHQVDPLGVGDAKPRLGWTLSAHARGAGQSAYEVEVSTTRDGPADVWDSGKVRSSRSFDIEYAGPALRSRTRYFWRVRVWDAAHRASRWSRPARFETAFLTPGEFQGTWIGSPSKPADIPLTGADWIWYPEGEPADSAPVATRYFRRAFDLPAGDRVTSARFKLSADDRFTLYVNGKETARSPDVADSWNTATVVDISDDLRSGRNVIAIEAANAAAGPAGLIGRLHVQGSTGDPLDLVTDDAWKSADTAATGWQQPDFDDSAWPAAMEAARYGDAPWYSSVSAPNPPEPLLRREFTARKRIASARAYIAGLGYYKLYLNGKRVGDHELDPAFTVYDKTVLYTTYDVTKALRAGDNALGVSLGRGYYAMAKPGEWNDSPWHSDPKLKLELDITYEDGSTQQVTSDGGWKAADGPTRTESVLYGETYDARLEQPGWNRPGFDDAAWKPALAVTAPKGTLRAAAFPPIKVTGRLPVKRVTAPRDGIRVHDFGTPTAGWARVAMRGPAGAVVSITYGEKLRSDGTVDNAGLQSYSYTLKGDGLESYRPSYSYNGFRYVQVDAPAGVTVASVQGERVHTAVTATGGFTSSSRLLNRYHDAQANTTLNNLHSIPTDTPMYEKRPYAADAHLTADSAIASFDMRNFYENWMRTHRDDQNPDGTLGHTVPATVGAKGVTDPVWSASFVLINWDLYWYYGDIRPLADNYGAMKKWLDHYEQTIAKTGHIYTGFSYGDWLAPGAAFPPEGTRLVGTAYIYKTATTMAQIARALGHGGDAAHFDALAAKTASAFNATFFDTSAKAYYDDRSAGYRQTSNLLPLSFGLVSKADRAAVLANLVNDIRTRGDHLNTGALGTKIILPVLTDSGNGDLAYKVATNPTYPGWGYWFQALGATTMWEEWQNTSRSHDHAFMGTVDDWLYQRVAGIEPAAPGYTKIKIQPYPVGGLKNASGHVQSPLGRVSSAWNLDRGRFTLRVAVPVGATAEILVPARDRDAVKAAPDAAFHGMRDGYAVFQVGSGDYVFHSAK
ncbi:glycoside hydrolase family 78 protein [Actinomadura madurae]|uniref:family 78 glycoside hydrolase catalytic domain n=1 Tax=Actinomadura madurae TaxID=1993 RepID=UPI0020269F25|nr:family 78 glycoside hydrolase catalytic domain [Actinomadura madurae]URM94014.1 glycoside hydrolase family 78 protein [Actinomadura madurae]